MQQSMMLPKGGINWHAARRRLPPARAVWIFVTKTRFLLCVALAGVILLLWRGISTSASEMQRFVKTTLPAKSRRSTET